MCAALGGPLDKPAHGLSFRGGPSTFSVLEGERRKPRWIFTVPAVPLRGVVGGVVCDIDACGWPCGAKQMLVVMSLRPGRRLTYDCSRVGRGWQWCARGTVRGLQWSWREFTGWMRVAHGRAAQVGESCTQGTSARRNVRKTESSARRWLCPKDRALCACLWGEGGEAMPRCRILKPRV